MTKRYRFFHKPKKHVVNYFKGIPRKRQQYSKFDKRLYDSAFSGWIIGFEYELV